MVSTLTPAASRTTVDDRDQPLPAIILDGAGVAGVAAAAPATIPYYNANTRLSPRARLVLRGFPRPTGPNEPSPLSDRNLGEFRAASQSDRAICQFGTLCNLLGLGTILFGVFPAILSFTSVGAAIQGPQRNSAAYQSGFLFGSLAFVMIYFGAGRAALKARLWGPLTVLVLLSLYGLLAAYGAWNVYQRSRYLFKSGNVYALIPALIAIGVLALLLTITIRAVRAVPRFLNAPVWCQEALVAARL
jgi:hypothetical protein